MAMHELKIWPQYFEAVRDGSKTFEVRLDDRGFGVGDELLLREWDTAKGCYTGRELHREVGYLLAGGAVPGIKQGYVCMGLVLPGSVDL